METSEIHKVCVCAENTLHIGMYCLPAAVIRKVINLRNLVSHQRRLSKHSDTVYLNHNTAHLMVVLLCHALRLALQSPLQKQHGSNNIHLELQLQSVYICSIGGLFSAAFHVFFPLPLSFSWLLGRRPEYTDPKVVAQGEGREGLLCISDCR